MNSSRVEWMEAPLVSVSEESLPSEEEATLSVIVKEPNRTKEFKTGVITSLTLKNQAFDSE